jgi:protoheme IX farnesyltransferase
MRFKDDYAAAGVPMLPVVVTATRVVRKILQYTYAMIATSLLLVPVAGWLYAAVAVLSGAVFAYEAHRLSAQVRAGQELAPMRLFHYSITYLTVLFVAVAVSPLV